MHVENLQIDGFQYLNLKADEFLVKIKEEIIKIEGVLNEIKQENHPNSFENTILKLVYVQEELNILSSTFFNLNSANTNEIFDKEAPKIIEILTNFSNQWYSDKALFDKVAFIYQNYHPKSQEETILLNKIYDDFILNGANLSEKDQERLKTIEMELGILSHQFSKNVLSATNDNYLHLLDENRLKGLPQEYKEKAKDLAQQKQKEGFVFSLHAPSYIPFLTYVEDRELRKKIFLLNAKKCFDNNEFNNLEVIENILKLRQQKTNLLGFKKFSDLVLKNRMVKTTERCFDFLNELYEKSIPYAQKDFKKLEDFAKSQDNIDQLQKWDTFFYTEKLKKSLFNINDEILKPYFETERTLKGLFSFLNKLFEIHFEVIETQNKYNEATDIYKITDKNQNLIAYLLVDLYNRPEKRPGAWMTTYKNQFIDENGINQRPFISMVCNFPAKTNELPSLLSFNEVKTLFHEMGHCLHGLFANTQFPNLSGTQVFWDFVELPSQFLENFCFEESILREFAYHFQTQEFLPLTHLDNIKKSMVFLEALQTIRQLSFGFLDLHFHSYEKPILKEQIKNKENQFLSKTNLYPILEDECISTSFSHIFSGGYASGYYSYKWAEVLEADCFEYFKENGIFNKEIAQKYKSTILSQGGTIPPDVLYYSFRGEEPQIDFLLNKFRNEN